MTVCCAEPYGHLPTLPAPRGLVFVATIALLTLAACSDEPEDTGNDQAPDQQQDVVTADSNEDWPPTDTDDDLEDVEQPDSQQPEDAEQPDSQQHDTAPTTPPTCAKDADCSFNGSCIKGACKCTSPWHGVHCNKLKLGVVDKAVYGYRQGFPYTTSWGGSVRYDDVSKQFLMLVSEYVGECDNWGYNSTVVLAASSKPEGPYKKKYRLFGVMSHEAMWAKGPSGEWVVYFTASEGPAGLPNPGTATVDNKTICTRKDYTSPCTCPGPPQKGSQDPTWMTYSKTPLDAKSWSKPVLIFDPAGHFLDKTKGGEPAESIDANFNGVILADGSLVGLWRTWQCVYDLVGAWATKLKGAKDLCFSVPHAMKASDWSQGKSYQAAISKQKNSLKWLFAEQFTKGHLSGGIEDPMVYRDNRQPPVYHAIFHQMFAPNDNVAHAYSVDGKNWTYTGDVLPLPKGETMPLVSFTDQTAMGLACERPQLIVNKGQPSHIIIGGVPKALAIPGGGDVSDSAEMHGWPGGATMVIPLVN